MNREQMAALINGREYRSEITRAEEAQAKASGLIVIFGASDDLLEFRGVVHDEVSAYDGTTALLHAAGVMPEWEDFDEKDDEAMARAYFSLKPRAKPIRAAWDTEGYSWVISADIPHATFEIVEDGEKYCQGIVIHVTDLADREA